MAVARHVHARLHTTAPRIVDVHVQLAVLERQMPEHVSGRARRKAWLWTVVTASVTVFMVHSRRTAEAARAILARADGALVGVLVSDRHGAYNGWADAKHQFCWSHLIRDFVKISERRYDSERIGKALLAEAARMFVWWHRVRDGTLARSTFRVYMRLVQRRDLFIRRYSGMTSDDHIRSRLVATGVLPSCKGQLDEHGVRLPEEMLRAAAGATKEVCDAAE